MLHLLTLLPLLTAPAHAREQADDGSTYTIVVGPDYRTDFNTQPGLIAGVEACEALKDIFATDMDATALCGSTEVTRDSVLRTLTSTVSAIDDQDTLLFIYIGSGWTSAAGESYLLPSNYAADDLAGTSISIERDVLWTLRQLEGKGQVTVLIDAIHSDVVQWVEYEGTDLDVEVPHGIFTIGPSATDFSDTIATNIQAISATDGQDTTDDNLFGVLLVRAFTGEADANDDGVLTYGELEAFVVLSSQDVQTPGLQGSWTAARDEPLIAVPEQPKTPRRQSDFDLASLRKPARYTGIGLTTVGCASLVVGRVMVASAVGDANDGYASRGEYDEIVGRHRLGGTLYQGGIGACSTGLGLLVTSLVIGGSSDKPAATLSPTANGFAVQW